LKHWSAQRCLNDQEVTAIDEELVARAQKRDEDAFEQLVLKYQRYVFNLAYRVLNDRTEAEDVTQEAFIRAWRGLPRFRAQAQFKTWLYRIVHNLCLNRRPGLQRELSHIEPLEEILADPAPSLAGLSESHERMALLHHQLEQLPEKYRLVLTLRHLQNVSYQEIAEVLGLPMGTVKTHIYRARRALADRLFEWEQQANGNEDTLCIPVDCTASHFHPRGE
jgi:RNA polymerase sigma-70 factor (ECF subfamily)